MKLLSFTILLTCHAMTVYCYPQPQALRIPEFRVTSAEDVNSLGRKDDSRSFDANKKTLNTIEDTVKEVENLIKSNPALPRLTRGEILDLLENITRTDLEKTKLLNKFRDPKSLMVVMPYTPNSNNENIEDLYTKPPVTRLEGGVPFKHEITTNLNKVRRPNIRPMVIPNSVVDEVNASRAPVYRRRRPVISNPLAGNEKDAGTTPTTKKNQRRRPEIITEPYQIAATTQQHISRRPMKRRPTPQPTKYQNHKYPEDEYFNKGIHIISPPRFSAAQINHELADLNLAETNIEETYLEAPKLPSTSIALEPSQLSTTPNESKPINLIDSAKPPFKSITDDIIPDNLKHLIKDMNFGPDISGLDDSKNDYMKTEQVKDLLASMAAVKSSTISPTSTNTGTPMPDIGEVANNLSPEMKNLLMNFGLIPNENSSDQKGEVDNIYYPEKAEIDPKSYIGFKPLPEDQATKGEMDELLASFGLGRSARKQKAIIEKPTEPATELNFDMVPQNLSQVLKDIGLMGRESKKIEPSSDKNAFDTSATATTEKQHVFNPNDQQATVKEIEKLTRLMGVVKQLKSINGTISDEELKKIDIDSLLELAGVLGQVDTVPLNQQSLGPNPIDFDVGLSKNEVKRQENSTEPPESTVVTTTTSSTNEEPRNPALADLEASFGGQVATEAAPVETTTINKQTGFYYLVDWNSFLDIDDTKGKRVNLRFQPTIGDPKRFLSVSVP